MGLSNVKIGFSHEVKLDKSVEWLAVCSDSSGFASDSSGRVVAARSKSNDDREALPQPCIFTAYTASGMDHLLVLSLDGSKKLRCHCQIDFGQSINGLCCDRKRLVIAQYNEATVTDLSGLKLIQIKPDYRAPSVIHGLGFKDNTVFLTSRAGIFAYNSKTGKLLSFMHLPLRHASLGKLLVHGSCLLVIDKCQGQVHRVHYSDQRLVTSHPTEHSGLERFWGLSDVAIDKKGRLFVSECVGQSVRVVNPKYGSLLGTVGEPGSELGVPGSLAVATVDKREQLVVVVGGGNNRIVVLNIL